ncbi:putative oxidoreductase [Triangularia setosa]|uniref:Oxidoreductase n=1 Tax=Triangularia setosa TaxID=2587417 RepID=A0AAN7A7D2_9PEZI|nr:putative oxidoreductase [Podospora setosa]
MTVCTLSAPSAMSSLPLSMKTLVQLSPHSPSITLTTSPLPVPSHSCDVLIKVYTTAPCKGELTWAANFPGVIPSTKTPVPSQDLAGTIVSLPSVPNTRGFKLGDRVYCRIDAARPGAAREYALARLSELALIPENLGWVEAAATPLSSLTAWQALFTHGGLNKDGLLEGKQNARGDNAKKRVLITGAAGGVGSWAVQLAALAGCQVVGLCGPNKVAHVKELGATEVLNYRDTSLQQWASSEGEADVVVDMVGGKTLGDSWFAVKHQGRVVSICGAPEGARPGDVRKEDVKSNFFIVEPSGENLAEIGRLVEDGKVRPTVDSVWAFEDYEAAFERLESGQTTGKVVIRVVDFDE